MVYKFLVTKVKYHIKILFVKPSMRKTLLIFSLNWNFSNAKK